MIILRFLPTMRSQSGCKETVVIVGETFMVDEQVIQTENLILLELTFPLQEPLMSGPCL